VRAANKRVKKQEKNDEGEPSFRCYATDSTNIRTGFNSRCAGEIVARNYQVESGKKLHRPLTPGVELAPELPAPGFLQEIEKCPYRTYGHFWKTEHLAGEKRFLHSGKNCYLKLTLYRKSVNSPIGTPQWDETWCRVSGTEVCKLSASRMACNSLRAVL
jgi:hypothetical protein